MKQFKCQTCNALIYENNILTADHPFDKGEKLCGCPKCLDIETLFEICDETGCTQISTCGFPTKDKYRRTCGEHFVGRK